MKKMARRIFGLEGEGFFSQRSLCVAATAEEILAKLRRNSIKILREGEDSHLFGI